MVQYKTLENTMKKRFLIIFSLMMAMVMTIFASGCSACNTSSPLSFTNAFLGGGTPAEISGYTETLEYKVEFDDNYNSRLKKDSTIPDKIAYEFNDGIYKTELIAGKTDGLQTSINIDGELVYYLKTTFTITAEYSVDGDYAEGGIDATIRGMKGKAYNDEIVSEVYFLKAGQSFAPLYSKTSQKYSLLHIGGDKASVGYSTCEYETIYKNGSYTTKTITGEKTETKTSEYTFKQAIDNVQLLFALRNVNIAKDGSYSLPTTSPVYSEPQTLSVSNNGEETTSAMDIEINGQVANGLQIHVKNYSFAISAKNNTGIAQYVKIQTAKSGNLDYNAHMIEYASPLVSYGSFGVMGALVYKLSKVEIK